MADILKLLLEEKSMNYNGGLYHETQIKLAYNSNRIEGSSLTEEQTRFMYETSSVLPETGSCIKTDDIIEMNNHFFLFNKMLDTVNRELSQDLIKEYHYILKRGTSDERKEWFAVGDYKKVPNTAGMIETSAPENVETDIRKLLEDYHKSDFTDINRIIDFHVKFEKIHPYQDGNGRIGRIIMFRECLKNNITPFIIQDKNKAFYYRGLQEYLRERGFLLETCLHEQDVYAERVKYFTRGR
ncbi:MAG: Fic family protein [Oscillospiraceae bacterium]|nr:Fic family protein [Oscillospiraceae bacterium]